MTGTRIEPRRQRAARKGWVLLAGLFLGLAPCGHTLAQLTPGQGVDFGGAPVTTGLSEQVWIGVNGQSQGPLAPAQVRQKINAREITPDTQVWTKSLNSWTRAADFPPIAQLLGNGGPPGPPPTPTPGPAQQNAADKMKSFLVGEWTVEAPGAYDGVTVRLIVRYDAGGRYTGIQQTFVSVGGAPPQLGENRPIEGSWKVQPLGERSFSLTLTGGNSGTVRLEILDQNTVRDMDREFVATRTGG